MGYGVGFRRAVNANTLYPQSLIRAWLFPAEDVGLFAKKLANAGASMRPRVFPAEDVLGLTDFVKIPPLQ